jgi:hypothetical protein
MVPFRYARGHLMKNAANQEACRQNLPGLKRHKGGIISGKNWFGETARQSNASSLPKIWFF